MLRYFSYTPKSLLFLFPILLTLCFNAVAQEGSEKYVLTVRQLPNADYEAVISYDTDVYCFLAVTPASSVEVIGRDILITSPESDDPILCVGAAPPFQYFEETARIGALDPGIYTVSWVQPEAFSHTIQFETGVSRIPSSSPWSLLLLIFGVLVVVHLTSRARGPTSLS